jgi:hypothetical protein
VAALAYRLEPSSPGPEKRRSQRRQEPDREMMPTHLVAGLD